MRQEIRILLSLIKYTKITQTEKPKIGLFRVLKMFQKPRFLQASSTVLTSSQWRDLTIWDLRQRENSESAVNNRQTPQALILITI